MKFLKNFLPHLAIAMAVGLVVIMILDGFNPLMKFLTRDVTRAYIVILAIVVVISSVISIAENRKNM